MRVSHFSPAKINLFLAVTGRRADGFHDLVSVAAPLDFGDDLVTERADAGAGFTLSCDVAEVPVDESNLILKAAHMFVETTGWRGGASFSLTKRIPMGAGLGGGSSNAVAALRALNEIAGGVATEGQMAAMAARLGSDCALFLRGRPVVMRGRGERVDDLPSAARVRLSGRRTIVFKPSFGIATPWAYGRMVARGGDYLAAETAEVRLERWIEGGAPAEKLLFNNMEAAAFEKFVALPVMLARLRRECGLEGRMSGSGSACFALVPDEVDLKRLEGVIRDGWGPTAVVFVAALA